MRVQQQAFLGRKSRERAAPFGEPLVELLVAVKERGHDEMQQRPELGHGVLDGRSREEQSVTAAEGQQGLPPLAATPRSKATHGDKHKASFQKRVA